MKLTYVPNCIRLEVRLPREQRILCSDCFEKMYYGWQAQIVFSYFVLHRSKTSLVFTTKVTHLRSLLFRQLDRVSRQSSAVGGLRMLMRPHGP